MRTAVLKHLARPAAFAARRWRRLDAKSVVTLVATALLMLLLGVVCLTLLAYARSGMRHVLQDQQYAFVARVADDLDQKMIVIRDALAAAARDLPAEAIADPDKAQKWLAERPALNLLFNDLFIVTAQGAVVADQPPIGRRNISIGDRPYFRDALATRRPQISQPFMGRFLRQPVVALSAPVLDGEGRAIGVISGSLNLLRPNFLGNLAKASVGKTGTFAVFTRERVIVVSRDAERVMTAGPPAGVSPYFDRATAGREGSEEAVNSRGLHAIFSYSQLESVPWVLVASLPVQEAYAPIREMQRNVALLAALVGVLAAGFIWYCVRRWYEPVKAALRERDAGLRRAHAMARLAYVIVGPDGRFESWSDSLPDVVGRIDPATIPGTIRDWQSLVHPDDRAGFRASAIDAGTKRRRTDFEYRLVRADGEQVHIRQTIEPLELETGRWFITLKDVSDHQRAAARIARLNRVYAVLSGINTAIVRIRDRDTLFREACRVAVEAGRFRLAWIGLVDEASGLVRPVASAGEVGDFFDAAPLAVIETKPGGHGLAGRAIRSQRAMISNNVADDPQRLMRRELAERNINSLAVMPLVVGETAVGVLALYAADVGFFDEEEMKLLNELSQDVAFALEHIAKTEQIDYLADYDSLTGLPNRRQFFDRVSRSLEIAASAGRKLAVLVVDLDRFKSVNDSLGREAGDEVLKEVSARMRKVATDPTAVARLGADRFAIIRFDVSSQEDIAEHNDRKMREVFGDPLRVAGTELRLSASVGVAIFPDHADDAESLFRNAESALGRAKATGDRLLFYTRQMNERISEQLGLETRLRRAIERDEFVLHYQPKVRLEDGRIEGVEALIRWQSPEEGLVPPGRFISLLERTGLILPVGIWALSRAMADHARWTAAGLRAPRVAVNVSPIQLRQKDFIATIKQAIGEAPGQAPIDLEITESLIMEEIEANIAKIHAVRALGLQVAIDDFGTGYSSLSYLAKLPVQSLKIDRSFVTPMTDNRSARMLVSTIISLAHSLNLGVIAEGVETRAQADALRELGCEDAQGYLFSKPVPADALAELLRRPAPLAPRG